MNESRVDEEDVMHIASLARVKIDDSETSEYVEQFDKILDRFDRLDEVEVSDTKDEELESVLRPDIIEESITQEEALENAPESDSGYFEGPSVK